MKLSGSLKNEQRTCEAGVGAVQAHCEYVLSLSLHFFLMIFSEPGVSLCVMVFRVFITLKRAVVLGFLTT